MIEDFLVQYSDIVFANAQQLRELVKSNLKGVNEVLDIPAKMVAYTYGPKYADAICVIIPSKKGLKLGFNRGPQLPDPENLLKGNGKISRYIEIKTKEDIKTKAIKHLLKAALKAYKELK
jgi:hypothetical protein